MTAVHVWESEVDNCNMASEHVKDVVRMDVIPSDSDLNVSNYVPEITPGSKSSDVNNSRTEQLTDESLNNCFSQTRQGKGKLFLRITGYTAMIKLSVRLLNPFYPRI